MGDLYDDSIFKRREDMLKKEAAKQRWITVVVVILLGFVILGLGIWRYQKSMAPAAVEKKAKSGVVQVSIPDKSLINVNQVSVEELTQLPGVGPDLAEKILAGRPYATPEDLKRIPGIGEKNFERMKSRVSVK
jgi:competence protein ComEA